jgi:hypothetical protein
MREPCAQFAAHREAVELGNHHVKNHGIIIVDPSFAADQADYTNPKRGRIVTKCDEAVRSDIRPVSDSRLFA